MPVRYLFLDEVDSYPSVAGDEGDPVQMAIERTNTFGRRKILMTSTPSLVGFSRIGKAFDETDQRKYHVPCKDCGHMAPLTWSRVKWPEDKPQDAYIICDECGGVHTDRDKPAMLASGEWRPTVEGGDPKAAGFHISSLYSPWVRFGALAAEFVRVHKDPAQLQVFTNAKLGECWEDQAGETIPAGSLLARREDWGDKVPNSVNVLTVGVDVQTDRLECQILGWGKDEEVWVIAYLVLWGSPSDARVWLDLDRVLSRVYPRIDGIDLPISAACIDSGGHHTREVYNFCRPRLHKKVWGIKGAGGPGIPAWPKRPSRVDGKAGKLTLFRIGVDSIKDTLFARLKLTESGPGFIHFNKDADPEYFRQLTGEKVVTKYNRGRAIRTWQPRTPDQALEALDTFVYGMAALYGLLSYGIRFEDMSPTRIVAPAPRPPAPEWFGPHRDNWI